MIIIKCEFTRGSEIVQCFKEAKRIATLFDCEIQFNFNGIICSAQRESNVEIGCDNYKKLYRLKNKPKLCEQKS